MSILINVENLQKVYLSGDIETRVLRGITFKIEKGEFVSIMGPSGSGKSTLMHILGLLDRASSGLYEFEGVDVTKLSDNELAKMRNEKIGFVFQAFNLLPRTSVLENVKLPLAYSNDKSSMDSRAGAILKNVGLEHRLTYFTNQISGGEKQRVAIARALANQPLIIFADEPTGNLDSKSSLEIINLLKELNAQGTTIVMVTHERELSELASRIITLKDGEVVGDERKGAGKAVAKIDFNNHLKRKATLSLSGILNYAHEAFLSLLGNKLRSFLSILGVLIGVAAVITMLAIGTGAQNQVQQSLASMGSNLLRVSQSFRSGGISLGADSTPRFNFEDLAAMQKIDGVDRVVPYVSGRAQMVFQDKNWNTSVSGTNPDYQYVRNSIPTSGRFFNDNEVTGRAKVAVLGKTVADELFGSTDPVGKAIRINRINFTVIGVMPEKGATGFQNTDDQVFIPVTTAMYRLLGRDYIGNFDVQVKDADSLSAVQEQIGPILAKVHRFTEAQMQSIDVRNMADIQKALNDVVNTFTMLLGSIAAVSLLVGGIGIMNIMLVLVMERTHEIGLRKALGAENRDIMIQFLVESVLICVLGGSIGIMIGSLIAWLISTVFGWNAIVSLGSILLAFTFSVLVGVVFGIWPAWRASKMLPIEALRYE